MLYPVCGKGFEMLLTGFGAAPQIAKLGESYTEDLRVPGLILGFGKPVVFAKYSLLEEVVNGSFSKRSRQNTADRAEWCVLR